jgi:hypothetical protein
LIFASFLRKSCQFSWNFQCAIDLTPHSVKQTNTVLGFHRQVSTDFSRKSLLSLWLGHWGWGSAVTEANLLSKTHGACGEAEEDQAGDEQGGNGTYLHAYEFDVMLSAMRLSNLLKSLTTSLQLSRHRYSSLSALRSLRNSDHF